MGEPLVPNVEAGLHDFLYQSSAPFLLLMGPSEQRHLPYFCHKVNLPGLTTTPLVVGNQNSPAEFPGHGAQKEGLVLECWTDAELRSWIDTYQWVMRASRGSSHDDTNLLLENQVNPPSYRDATMSKADGSHEYYDSTTVHGASRAVMLVLGNRRVPFLKVTFEWMFPKSIGGIDLSTTTASSDPMLYTVEMRYNNIAFERINNPDTDPIMADPRVQFWLESQRRITADQPQA